MQVQENIETVEVPFDEKATQIEISEGAKAVASLRKQAGQTWRSWSLVIRGLRGLRELAFSKTPSRDMKSYDYRMQMSRLLSKREYGVYEEIDKPTRSVIYKMMDHVDEIDDWYFGLDFHDQQRWTHPQTVAKHCPQNLLVGLGHNKPKPGKGKKKKGSTAEEDRLRRLATRLIQELVPFKPEAAKYLDELHADDPDDQLEDLYGAEAVDGEE